MATAVYDIVTFTLQDGKEVTVRPLNIKRLRKFMKVVQDISEVKDTDQEGQLDKMLEACAVILAGQFEGSDDVEILETLLDIPTINRMMEVAGGVSADSPNLREG